MKTKILKILRNADGFVSGQAICESLGVSRTAVWKVINQLKEEGYEFDAVSNKGYRIVNYPDILTKSEIESQLDKNDIIKKIVFFDETDSTNNRAKKAAEEGEESGTYAMFPQVAPKFFEKRNAKAQGVDADHADFANKSHPV